MAKDVTEDAYERIQKLLSATGDDDKVHNAKMIALSKMEKQNLYQNILDLIKSGQPAHTIAKEVITIFDEVLAEKRELATGKTMKGPVFRRSED